MGQQGGPSQQHYTSNSRGGSSDGSPVHRINTNPEAYQTLQVYIFTLNIELYKKFFFKL